jgi:hypothetical protein
MYLNTVDRLLGFNFNRVRVPYICNLVCTRRLYYFIAIVLFYNFYSLNLER